MADEQLQTILNSGGITNINIGGVTSADKVLKQSEVDAKDALLDARITDLENSHSILLIANSTATSQEPTALDTPLQVEFGPLQTTTDIGLSATGAFTFNTTGRYILSLFFQYGRNGASGTSWLMNRILINGVQQGGSLAAKIDNPDVLIPWSSSIIISATAGDIMTIQIIRDSAGNNSGGLFSVTSTVGWNTAPCASIQIYKVN